MAEESKLIPNPDTAEGLEKIRKEDLTGGYESGFDNEKEKDIFSPEKEVAKEISGAEKDASHSKPSPGVFKDEDEEVVKTDAEIIKQKKMDAESNINHLVELATLKGVTHAVKVARRLDDNYVLDMMHDKLLSEELHKALLEKNLISED
ncbi:MAG: hypothetical protein V3574_02220 [Candidatus Moraniibacteriota bacterium]